MRTRNPETSRKFFEGYLAVVFFLVVSGSLLYKQYGPLVLIGGWDFGFVTGLLMELLLITNIVLGILMKYSRIKVNFDLHILIGSTVLGLGVIHALYNYSVLY